MHYLYVAAPVGFVPADCEPFRAFLETKLAQHQPVINSVKLVMRENLYGFQGNQKTAYIKVTVTDPKFITRVRTKIKDGEANYKGMFKWIEGGILTFDNIQYVLRFMIDTKVYLVVRKMM